ncbi:hypothetical protein LPB137_08110 [Poseidonibacter parvus]|uniref:Uncharacterized protein n=1 Tax=Poseidonibacter parvus TaxID=1850254 RepID=A0A1P8KMM4_9BACT|nr:hypothetical protein [Poseidonibacter parvus]APW65820.1 hypothetical protein LPB137_08110 [Poseidonibacter parvus]
MDNSLTTYIAIYGAILSSIAIIINILQYNHSKKEKELKFDFFSTKNKYYDINLKNMNSPYDPMTGSGGANTAHLYDITVKNLGSIDLYINEIYGVSKDDNNHYVLLEKNSISSLSKLDKKDNISIKPKSSKDFKLYFSKGSESFDLKSVIVIDGTARKIEKRV